MTLGTFTLAVTIGVWAFTIYNSDTDVNALTAISADGATSQTFAIAKTSSNDSAAIKGEAAAP